MEAEKIRSAVVDGKHIDVKGVQTLAKLPGLNELRAKLLGMINQPAGKVVRTTTTERLSYEYCTCSGSLAFLAPQ